MEDFDAYILPPTGKEKLFKKWDELNVVFN